MKKTISLVLCVAMILSTLSFCLPAMALEIDFGVESSEDYVAANDPEGINASVFADSFVTAAKTYTSGAVGATLTLTAGADADWTVSDETIASIEGNGTTAVLTAKGYSGEVVVTATSKADPNVFGTIKIHLRGGTKIRPGANLLTGTTEAYTFEDGDASLVFTSTEHVKDNPLKTGNTSAKVAIIASTSSNYPSLTMKNVSDFDTARPVAIEYDYTGAFRNHWVMINSTAGGDIFANMGSKGFTTSDDAWKSASYYGVSEATNKYDTLKHLSIRARTDKSTSYKLIVDNIKFIPYYKITYHYTNGDVIKTIYDLPEGTAYNPLNSNAPALPSEMYVGWTNVEGGTTAVTSVPLEHKDIDLWAVVDPDVEVTSAVSVSGYDGKTTDVDLRYPGAYYKFDKKINKDTLTLENVKRIGIADSFYYDETDNTLILFPAANTIKPGASIAFPGVDVSDIKLEDGTYASFPSVTITHASSIPDDGANMIPYGDYEKGFAPLANVVDTRLVAAVEKEGDNSILAARGLIHSNSTPHLYYYGIPWEDGATYKVSGKVKHLGVFVTSGTAPAPKSVYLDIVFGGKISGSGNIGGTDRNFTDASSTSYTGADGGTYYKEHTLQLGSVTDWVDFSGEFSPDIESTTASMSLAFYANASSSRLSQFAIDDLKLYKRTDVVYTDNDYVTLADNATVPEKTGVYLNETNTKVTIAEMPFVVTDNRRIINGWVDQDGNRYEVGKEYTITKPITLEPYIELAPGYSYVTVKFEGDVTGAPEAITDALIGDTINLEDSYEGVTSAIEHKRFNGWSLTGKAVDFTENLTITQDIITDNTVTLKAIVNYDWNMAVPANAAFWNYYAQGSVVTIGNTLWGKHGKDKSSDVNFAESSLHIPMGRIMSTVVVYDENYVLYSDKSHTSKQDLKFNQTDVPKRMYWRVDGTYNDSTMIMDPAYIDTYTEGEETFVGYRFDNYKNSYWKADKVADLLRFDPKDNFVDAGIRYIGFIGYPTYEEDITISDLTAPVAGELPDSEATATNASGVAVEWTTTLSSYGTFKSFTAYEATVTITPDDTLKRYRDDVKVYFGSAEATSVTTMDNGTVVATFTFPETGDYLDFGFNLDNVPETLEITNTEPVQFEINITEEPAEGVDTTVKWSLGQGAGIVADITEDGLLTVYKAGTIEVNAMSVYNETESYSKTVEISLSSALKAVTINFAGDIQPIAPITRLAGTNLDLTAIEVAISAQAEAEGKRFNGWTATGELADLVYGSVELPEAGTDENLSVTYTAVVNHDINFAVPANQSGWAYSGGAVSYSNDRLYADSHMIKTDVTLTNTGFNIPNVNRYAIVEFYIDKAYSISTGAAPEQATPAEFAEGFSSEGIYFSRTGESDHADRRVGGSVTGFAGENGEYAVFTYNAYKNDLWSGKLAKVRFDIASGHYDYAVRYIRFVEAVPFEETNIAIDIAVPETGTVVDNAPEVNEIGIVSEVQYSPENFISYTHNGVEYRSYNAEETYTVTIKVKPNNATPNCFDSASTATVNGNAADVVIGDDGIATVTYTFGKTSAFEDIAITVSGPDEITRAGRTTQYTARITAADGSAVTVPTSSVTWSLAAEDEGYAVIDASTGRLTPIRNKEEGITLYATSNYNPAEKASVTVKLLNQASEAVVIYNTTGGTAVDPTTGAGSVVLTTEVPTRAGFEFAGWALSDETVETVTEVAVYADEDENPDTEVIEKTVYAVWDKVALEYNFNNANHGFSVGNGSMEKSATYLILKTNGSGSRAHDIRLTSPANLTIDPKKVTSAKVRLALDTTTKESVIIYFWAQGQSAIDGNNKGSMPEVKSYALDQWVTVTVDFSGDPQWGSSDNISRFAIDPFEEVGHVGYLDYIKFIDTTRNVTFYGNMPEGVTVDGMPEALSVKQGDTVTVTQIPETAGYKFMGWSKSSDGSTGFVTDFVVIEDTVLYAIWDKTYTEADSQTGAVTVGDIEITSEENALLVEGTAGTKVTLTYGEDGSKTETVGSTGYAAFDLSEETGTLTNVVVTPEEGGSISSVTVTSAAVAEQKAEEDSSNKTYEEVTVNGAGSSGSSGGSYKYDTTVETVTKPGTIDPSTMYPEEEETDENGEPIVKFEGYPEVNTGELPFDDVKKSKWYYSYIEQAYKLGFVEGKTDDTFDPEGNVTVAEAITLAVRLNHIYYGNEVPESAGGTEWYKPFVDAALKASIIKDNQFTDYNAPALRKQVAMIMAKALPSSYVNSINMFTSIPDVPKKDSAYSSVLKLYNAGIVKGVDETFSFLPETNITRAEMATIVNRLAIPEERERIITDAEREARRVYYYAEDMSTVTLTNCTTRNLTIKDGFAYATGKTTDPIVTLNNMVGQLDGAAISKITVAFKWDTSKLAAADPMLYFTIPGGGWAADRKLLGKKSQELEGGVVEYTFDPKSNSQFANTITQIRFDPFQKKDIEFALAYIIIE